MIVCAAIKTSDGKVWSVPKPYRHDGVFASIAAVTGLNWRDPGNDGPSDWGRYLVGHVQGFVTDAGAFLDRAAALDHAVACRQRLLFGERLAGGSILTSEDLW